MTLTVADLRKALEGVPDRFDVLLDVYPFGGWTENFEEYLVLCEHEPERNRFVLRGKDD